MELTDENIRLIRELELLVGCQCYNPNSLNGYTLEEGRQFRYPVWYTNKEGDDRPTKGEITNIDADGIDTIRYKFGSNHLYIGSALKHVLDHLERTYGLDFNKLAKKKKAKGI